MDGPFEVDSRGKDTERDPRYYVITDRFGRIICDTLNCDSRFEPDEQRAALEEFAGALNRSMAPTEKELTVAMCGAKPMPEGDATGCEHKNQDAGFGLAGGGYGAYMYCVDCGFIVSKVQTD